MKINLTYFLEKRISIMEHKEHLDDHEKALLNNLKEALDVILNESDLDKLVKLTQQLEDIKFIRNFRMV